LYLQGWSQVAIADQVGVSQATVCEDLKNIEELWRQSSVRDFDRAQNKELAKLDRIERESWSAWDRSQKPQQSAVIQGESQQPTKKTLKNQIGDPRFLDQIHKCVASRRAILGLDAPQRHEHSGPDGGPMTLATMLAAIDKAPAPPPPAAGHANVVDEDAEYERLEQEGQEE
jgi:hypothetical protein